LKKQNRRYKKRSLTTLLLGIVFALVWSGCKEDEEISWAHDEVIMSSRFLNDSTVVFSQFGYDIGSEANSWSPIGHWRNSQRRIFTCNINTSEVKEIYAEPVNTGYSGNSPDSYYLSVSDSLLLFDSSKVVKILDIRTGSIKTLSGFSMDTRTHDATNFLPDSITAFVQRDSDNKYVLYNIQADTVITTIETTLPPLFVDHLNSVCYYVVNDFIYKKNWKLNTVDSVGTLSERGVSEDFRILPRQKVAFHSQNNYQYFQDAVSFISMKDDRTRITTKNHSDYNLRVEDVSPDGKLNVRLRGIGDVFGNFVYLLGIQN